MVLERGEGGYRETEEREREGERERENINVREKHLLVASDRVPNPQSRYVPRLGIKPTTFRCMGQQSSPLSHLARA